MPSPRVSFYTLGCRVNQYETRRWMAQLPEEIAIVPITQTADIVVINSCLVTSQAERDTRQIIHRARRSNPEATIITTGCYVDLHDDTGEIEPGMVIFSREEKDQIPAFILRHLGIEYSGPRELPGFAPAASRPPLLIQTGCDKRCAYCIIPHVRGASWSRPSEEIFRELTSMAGTFGEVVLTGINLGSWQEGSHSFGWLLEKLLDLLGDKTRIRMGSIEPEYVTDHVISLMSHERLAPHIHLPLQGTSNPVLRDMGRPGTVDAYRRLIDNILQVNPLVAVGADVIAGYPTETDEHHRAGMEFVRDMPLAYLHVFPYSSRPGTRAAQLKPLKSGVARERARELRTIDAGLRSAFLSGFVGRTVLVATERRLSGKNLHQGMAGEFFPVNFTADLPPERLQKVRITHYADTIKGVALDRSGALSHQ
ncbi:MiaB/RimO family radical SAM methylthiotransferase [Myxococcota bacterium]|nr:MiaB/RimO family radical SAM methylthiotransferase [Myxococcota bacterium]MBU1537526.1 MiaB/RimO family radical SAM methylthiotransferase [Myxococcota bacterium]